MKTLYKRDNRGKIRTLELSTEGSLFVQVSGLEDGKKVRHEKECKPKNVGKSNSTTEVEQAEAEMQAKYEIKLSEGYFVDKQIAETEEVLMPMLAKVYEEHSTKIDWKSAFIQPKLDGMRCLAIVKDGAVKLLSRKNKAIETMIHIEAQLMDFADGIYDGELYAHGKTFQENMRLIKKVRAESLDVKFHIYDMVEDKPFLDRYSKFVAIYTPIREKCPSIKRVQTYRLEAERGIKLLHTDFLSDGYEGTMIRWGTEGYKVNGRSDKLLKYKEFQDIACEIIDIEPAEQRPTWGVPVLKYTVKKLTGVNETIFRAGTKMSHDERKELLINKDNYIGKTGEIRFFEWSEDGVPRFPIMVGIRLDC